MSSIEFAVIGGSGLYDMDGLTEIEEKDLDTPFGKPSAPVTVGTLAGRRVAFLPRHGRGHILSPSEVPYRANIAALKLLGCKYIIAVSACDSLREDVAPGHILVPDQLFDHTKGVRPMSFFGDGLVAHISVADPFSAELSHAVAGAVREAGGVVHEGGAFITIEGPRFSTRGESHLYRQWGMSIIGMTTSPEAFLAAEAEMAYAVMAHVTDYDVWHVEEEPVTVEMVIRVVQANTRLAQEAVRHLAADYDNWAGEWPVHNGLKDALITNPAAIPPQTRQKLAFLVDRYLP